LLFFMVFSGGSAQDRIYVCPRLASNQSSQ